MGRECLGNLENIEKKSKIDQCIVCFSSDSNFEECNLHKVPLTIEDSCTNCTDCIDIKNLVKAFQSHKHTFSCQKKNKLITIKETEGHGRNDNVTRGQKSVIMCSVDTTSHNFP